MARYKRFDRRKDANHGAICAALQKCGITVVDLEEPVDLLCTLHRMFTIEIKNPEGRDRLQQSQEDWAMHCAKQKLPHYTVRDIEDCILVYELESEERKK